MKMKKVISLGALLIDQIAKVDIFPGEDDEVFVSSLKTIPGGSAANFAANCSHLGLKAGFIGKVGNDFFGRFLVNELKKENVDTKGIVVKNKLKTGTVFVAETPDDRRMFAYSGAANLLLKQEIDLNHLNSFDLLHLADLENIEILKYAADNFNGIICLNPGALTSKKGDRINSIVRRAKIFICTKTEIIEISGETDLECAIKKIYSTGPNTVVVTLGKDGSIAYDGKKIIRQEAFKVQVKDLVGAGDSFASGFIFAFLNNYTLKGCLEFASASASLCIQKDGARAGVSAKEVKDLIKLMKD